MNSLFINHILKAFVEELSVRKMILKHNSISSRDNQLLRTQRAIIPKKIIFFTNLNLEEEHSSEIPVPLY